MTAPIDKVLEELYKKKLAEQLNRPPLFREMTFKKPSLKRRIRTQVASWVYRLGEWIDG